MPVCQALQIQIAQREGLAGIHVPLPTLLHQFLVALTMKSEQSPLYMLAHCIGGHSVQAEQETLPMGKSP